MKAGQVEWLAGPEIGYDAAFDQAQLLEKQEPEENIVAAKQHPVRAQPFPYDTKQHQIVGKRATIQIKIGDGFSQRHFVAQTNQIEAAAQMMRRHVALLD